MRDVRVLRTRCMALLVVALSVLALIACTRMPQVEPTRGLPDVTHIKGVGGRVVLSREAQRVRVLAEDGVVFEVHDGALRKIEDRADRRLPGVDSTGYPSLARMPEEHRRGVTMRRTRSEFGSPVEVSLTDGGRLQLEPGWPIRDFREVGLADIDGDRQTELVVMALGEPGICNDTMTGYIGWAQRDDDGTFGEVRWQPAIRSGIASLIISDIDRRPGEEIIVGTCTTFCNSKPSDLWVFSPQ